MNSFYFIFDHSLYCPPTVHVGDYLFAANKYYIYISCLAIIGYNHFLFFCI